MDPMLDVIDDQLEVYVVGNLRLYLVPEFVQLSLRQEQLVSKELNDKFIK
jgi:hypothetical protein